MTVTPQGLSPQWLTTLGMGSQPGSFSPAFPAPIGAEGFQGIPHGQSFQPSIWPQPAYAWQTPYGMPGHYGQSSPIPGQPGYGAPASFGSAQSGAGVQPQVPQFIGQLLSQVIPLAQQIILPQVIAMAVPLVQQLITQLAAAALVGQSSSVPPGSGSFAPGMRQYAGLS